MLVFLENVVGVSVGVNVDVDVGVDVGDVGVLQQSYFSHLLYFSE